MTQRISQRFIAEQLGVSRTTVSYVLSGRPCRIAPETARRIRDFADRSHYIPNAIARSLRKQKTHTIGIIAAGFGNDWIERIHHGMEPLLRAENYTPLFLPRGWDPARERDEIDWLMQHRVDGIMVCIPFEDNVPLYRRVRELGIPLVFIGDVPEAMHEASYVVWDNRAAARAIVEHLIGLGRRRVAFFGAAHQGRGTRERYEAYCAALRAAGLPFREELVFWDPLSNPNHYAPLEGPALPRLVRMFAENDPRRPDAIFGLNDPTAADIVNALHALGVAIPGQVAVAGLDNLLLKLPLGLDLTTIDAPLERHGELAVEALLRLIAEPHAPPVQHVIHHAEVIPRGTTAPSAG